MLFDAIVIGGGAAGMFCAAEAGKRRRKVLLIEHNAQLGRKILISGGGRCNFTNLDVRPENFISGNPHFCKSALSRYRPDDFIDLVRRHRIAFHEKKLGQLFCTESSRHIVEMLTAECGRGGVRTLTRCQVKSIDKHELFTVETSAGTFTSRSVVIAAGGLSFAKIGATGFGYNVARQFGLSLTEMRPSLVALVAEKGARHTALAGVSLDAEVTAGKAAFRENILFTHRGMSGPAILQASNYWRPEKPVTLDHLPDIDDLFAGRSSTGKQLGNFLSELLPKRFVEAAFTAELRRRPVEKLSAAEIETVTERIKHHRVRFVETEGYDRAEVTLGGVSTHELSSQTMESTQVSGLYFIGEVVDVTGWLGGYNFQWAWSSAFAAASAL